MCTYNILRKTTTVSLVTIRNHAKLFQHLVLLAMFSALYIISHDLFYNWKLLPLLPLHLFHPIPIVLICLYPSDTTTTALHRKRFLEVSQLQPSLQRSPWKEHNQAPLLEGSVLSLLHFLSGFLSSSRITSPALWLTSCSLSRPVLSNVAAPQPRGLLLLPPHPCPNITWDVLQLERSHQISKT